MAETKIITNSPLPNKQKKHGLDITGGVGGIAGVLIIGGVIGIVSLIRKRAAKKQQSMKEDSEHDNGEIKIKNSNGEEDDNGGQLLRSIKEEDPFSMVEKEISNTSYKEDEKKESIWKSDIVEIIKDKDGNGNGENVASEEIPPILVGDKDLLQKETEVFAGISEENSPMPMERDIHFVYEDDEDGETEREGSEGTGDSSVESNSEAIWPAESVELVTKDGVPIKENNKEIKENNKVPEIGIQKENGILKENADLQFLNHTMSAKDFVSRPTFIVWVVLAMALLYHFFEHYLPVVLSSK